MVERAQICHFPFISPEDFPEFNKILQQDNEFFDSYDDWEVYLKAREVEAWVLGKVPICLGVDPKGFREFLRSAMLGSDLDGLFAYAQWLGSESGDTDGHSFLKGPQIQPRDSQSKVH